MLVAWARMISVNIYLTSHRETTWTEKDLFWMDAGRYSPDRTLQVLTVSSLVFVPVSCREVSESPLSMLLLVKIACIAETLSSCQPPEPVRNKLLILLF